MRFGGVPNVSFGENVVYIHLDEPWLKEGDLSKVYICNELSFESLLLMAGKSLLSLQTLKQSLISELSKKTHGLCGLKRSIYDLS